MGHGRHIVIFGGVCSAWSTRAAGSRWVAEGWFARRHRSSATAGVEAVRGNGSRRQPCHPPGDDAPGCERGERSDKAINPSRHVKRLSQPRRARLASRRTAADGPTGGAHSASHEVRRRRSSGHRATPGRGGATSWCLSTRRRGYAREAGSPPTTQRASSALRTYMNVSISRLC